MSDTLKIDRALLERLAPADCADTDGHGDICCIECGVYETGPGEFPHLASCAWVAARRLLEAPVQPVLEVHVEEPPPRVIVVPIEGPMRR